MRKPRRKARTGSCEQLLAANLDIDLALQNLMDAFIESKVCTSCCLHYALGVLVAQSDLDLDGAKYIMECVLKENFAPPETLTATPTGGYIN